MDELASVWQFPDPIPADGPQAMSPAAVEGAPYSLASLEMAKSSPREAREAMRLELP